MAAGRPPAPVPRHDNDQRRSLGHVAARRSQWTQPHARGAAGGVPRPHGDGRAMLEPAIRRFRPTPCAWLMNSAPTHSGSSGRVFPAAMRATSLLRAWTARLAGPGVACERGDAGGHRRRAPCCLGGASWPSVAVMSWLRTSSFGRNSGGAAAPNAGALSPGRPWPNVSKGCRSRTPHSPPRSHRSRRTDDHRNGLEGGPIYALSRTSKRTWALRRPATRPRRRPGGRLVDRRRPRTPCRPGSGKADSPSRRRPSQRHRQPAADRGDGDRRLARPCRSRSTAWP